MDINGILACPICGNSLFQEGKSLYCEARHCYDLSGKGYVNLMPPSGHGGHGDDKLMVRARTEFLNRGYYDPLSEEIAALAAKVTPDGGLLVDAGCGEGKYSADVLNAISSEGKQVKLLGVDISKDALIQAAKRSREFCLCVASTAKIPVKDGAADTLLNIFSPWMEREFARVLKTGGTLIRVIPLERHLWELKEAVYDRPYENDLPDPNAEGFDGPEMKDIRYQVELKSSEEIQNLFRMTPYYYKSSEKDQAKLAKIQSLQLSLEFRILLYRRNPKNI